MALDQDIVLAKQDGVCVLTLNRPASLNSLSLQSIKSLLAALRDIDADNGVSAGAGVSIALAADIVVAAESASFVLTFAPRLGLLPDLGATWKLPRLLGWARAQAVTMLGERVRAADAAQWGMIWRCVPDAGLQDEARALAARLAAAPAGVCREVRLGFEAAQLKDLAGQMEFERLRQRELLDSSAFREGMAAFQEKRDPDFYRTGA